MLKILNFMFDCPGNKQELPRMEQNSNFMPKSFIFTFISAPHQENQVAKPLINKKMKNR